MFPSMTGDGYFQGTKKDWDIVREKPSDMSCGKYFLKVLHQACDAACARIAPLSPPCCHGAKTAGDAMGALRHHCDGKVLSVSLERSSGFPDLDREALTLPKRAQPLLNPQDDKPGDTIERVAPAEFFLTGRWCGTGRS
jgi:TonB family protein